MTEMSDHDGDTSNNDRVGNMQTTTQTPVTTVKDNHNNNNNNNHKISMQPHDAQAGKTATQPINHKQLDRKQQ
jgi:hypothetical protein